MSSYDNAAECFICSKNFHAFRRKHRCKACGKAVCNSCAKTHKTLSNSQYGRSNEPVRVCDRCVIERQLNTQERRRIEEIERARARQVAGLQNETYNGTNTNSNPYSNVSSQESNYSAHSIQSDMNRLNINGNTPPSYDQITSTSGNDTGMTQQNIGRSTPDTLSPHQTNLASATPASPKLDSRENLIHKLDAQSQPLVAEHVEDATEAEECAICLEIMKIGHAIFTTSCGHSFHWRCLKNIQKSDSANSDKCPSCRATMPEMEIKNTCEHPRVRSTHRFCRDCGDPVGKEHVKPRPDDLQPPPSQVRSRQQPPPQHQNPRRTGGGSSSTYRAGAQGAIVRCPQCRMQMRVLPHMYNMRVACPAGHQFQVAVQNSRGTRNPGYPGSNYRSNHESANRVF